MTIRLRRGFAVPLGQLPEPDRMVYGPSGTAATPPCATGSASAGPPDDAVEQARQQVQGPAIGLLVTGIFNWAMIPSVVWIVLSVMPSAMARGRPGYLLALLPLSAMLIASLIIFAALKMKRLQAYGLAIAASILAIIVSPGNLIGLPIGIWALVVLSQREVRAAFAQPPHACHWLCQCFADGQRTPARHVSSEHWRSQWHAAIVSSGRRGSGLGGVGDVFPCDSRCRSFARRAAPGEACHHHPRHHRVRNHRGGWGYDPGRNFHLPDSPFRGPTARPEAGPVRRAVVPAAAVGHGDPCGGWRHYRRHSTRL